MLGRDDTHHSNRTRSQAWEDEAPAEPIARRSRQSAPSTSRATESAALDKDASPAVEERKGKSRLPGSRFERQRNPWWRPATSAGRVLLLLAALSLLGGFTASAYLLKSFLGRDARFRISGTGSIDASGLTEVSRSEMLPVFGEDIGRNIFFVPLSERRRQLEQLPWVERATVMRLLPDHIRVSIVERQPVAFALQPNGLTGLVDADGVLLTMPAAMMAQRHYSFPVVKGINSSDSLEARRARMMVYQRLLSDLDAGGQKISTQISDVDITDPVDLSIRMQDDPVLLVIGPEHFLKRYQIYKQYSAQWRQLHPDLVSVDLRIEQYPVLSMPSGTNVAQAAAEENIAAADEASGSNPSDKIKDVAKLGHPESDTNIGRPQANVMGSKRAGNKPTKASMTVKKSLKSAKVRIKNKRRAAAKRVVLNPGKQRSKSTSRPAAVAAMGQ